MVSTIPLVRARAEQGDSDRTRLLQSDTRRRELLRGVLPLTIVLC